MEATKGEQISAADLEFKTRLLRDGETFAVRYDCPCGCHPQVKLRRGAEAAHEHCCCGVAHAAGPGARAHMDRYLAERRAAGEDAERAYVVGESEVRDPWDAPVEVAYALPRHRA